ncbi:MAG: DDE-type integrase/transposase/recombinase [Proteobacteria bacterium]|nr:DDE-type integrase/transposase/recombinase [Pseudomonadota bacterium]
MLLELRPGCGVVYEGLVGKVEEFVGHDSAVVRLDVDNSIIEVLRSALIPLAPASKALEKTSLAKIDDAIWERANARANAVREVVAMAVGRTEAARKFAHQLNISERQFWRLAADFERHGLVKAMIARVGGRPAGTTVLDPEVEKIIAFRFENDYLQKERPTKRAIYELVAADCRVAGLNPPAEATVRRRIDALMGREATLRREGSKKTKFIFDAMPGHVEAEAPLDRVEIDHTPLDVFARSDDPACKFIGRPWLTVAIDVCTRCVLGIHIGFEPPSSLSVALCLTHAALPKLPASEFGVPLDWPMHGLPKEIVVDNGKDFQSIAFVRGCDHYRIKLSYRPVGSPHYGGTIERLIGTMVGQCHLLPGTTKNSVKAKGDYDSQKHATLTLSEVRRWFVEQLLGRYHLRPHRMLRIPPLVAWQQAMNAEAVCDAA